MVVVNRPCKIFVADEDIFSQWPFLLTVREKKLYVYNFVHELLFFFSFLLLKKCWLSKDFPSANLLKVKKKLVFKSKFARVLLIIGYRQWLNHLVTSSIKSPNYFYRTLFMHFFYFKSLGVTLDYYFVIQWYYFDKIFSLRQFTEKLRRNICLEFFWKSVKDNDW